MHRKSKLAIAIFMIWTLLLMISTGSFAQNTMVIKAKKIYPASDKPIENGMILVKDGKIARVGKSFSIPKDARIIEAEVVIPGLIDIHTHVGVYSTPNVEENADGNEMTNPITPQVRALDSFNFDDPAIPVSRAGGVTTVVSRPGSGNIIGGTSVAVKLKNAPPDEMVIVDICDLKMALEGNPIGVYGAKQQMPATLMAVYYLAEKAFLDGQEYIKSWEKYEEKKKDDADAKPPKRELDKEALAMALKGEIPVHIHCATASEVMTSIRLADQFGLRLSLGHAYFAHLLVDEMTPYKETVHFNIGPPMFFNYYEEMLTFKNSPAILANAGYKVSLQTDALSGAQQNLRHLAMLCVRYGMKEADALKSITITAAEGVDLQDRVGSIEKGKDADLVLLDGEPFDFLTEVRKVIIDGKIEYEDKASPRPSLDMTIADAVGILNLPANLNQSDKIAIQGGTIFTMAGEPLKNGVVLMEKGKIKKVGKDLRIPGDYKVIDAGEFVVMPGLVAPRSYIGIGSNWRRQRHTDEMSKSIVPALEVKHAIEPHAPQFAFARELGVTTALVTPGNRNVIGGQGAVLKTSGIVVDKMIIKEKAIMAMGLGEAAKREKKMPSTRMGIAALLRETFIKVQEYKVKIDEAKEDKEGDDPKRDMDMEALLPVLSGETPVLIHCERKDDIWTALRIADEFGLKIILDGATDAYRMIDEIKKRNIAVILEDQFRGTGGIEDQGFNPENARLLNEAGIPITFRPQLTTGMYAPGVGEAGGDMLEIAAFAVKNGLNPDAALKAVTIDAARIIGMADRVGSLEPGKDADILILRGHPLHTRSIPEAVFIDGKLTYQRRPDARMTYK